MTTIRNCQIILGTGEDILAGLQKTNLFIGENSSAAIDALAEACCGTHNTNLKMRCVNFEFDYEDKTYVVTTVSTKDGTTALVKYPEDQEDYNEIAFFEFDTILNFFFIRCVFGSCIFPNIDGEDSISVIIRIRDEEVVGYFIFSSEPSEGAERTHCEQAHCESNNQHFEFGVLHVFFSF